MLGYLFERAGVPLPNMAEGYYLNLEALMSTPEEFRRNCATGVYFDTKVMPSDIKRWQEREMKRQSVPEIGVGHIVDMRLRSEAAGRSARTSAT